ncbi:MAG: MmcQ/YjbR family DNA-binding protein [Alcanivoracaceae bacterium]|jgi:predicted DNA-binding protein (MmcQ/YjbR family)|nr:MmcQ/YjbR family DNA-binding protein [Alcanivoracaceae bacterium]
MPGDCAEAPASEQALAHMLLALPAVTDDYPFGPDTRAFRIEGRIFALVYRRHGELCINLKCDPDQAQQLRDVFDCVRPGYHMNKRHWNTVVLDGSLPHGEVLRQMQHAWQCVVAKLPAARRRLYQAMSLD